MEWCAIHFGSVSIPSKIFLFRPRQRNQHTAKNTDPHWFLEILRREALSELCTTIWTVSPVVRMLKPSNSRTLTHTRLAWMHWKNKCFAVSKVQCWHSSHGASHCIPLCNRTSWVRSRPCKRRYVNTRTVGGILIRQMNQKRHFVLPVATMNLVSDCKCVNRISPNTSVVVIYSF